MFIGPLSVYLSGLAARTGSACLRTTIHYRQRAVAACSHLPVLLVLLLGAGT